MTQLTKTEVTSLLDILKNTQPREKPPGLCRILMRAFFGLLALGCLGDPPPLPQPPKPTPLETVLLRQDRDNWGTDISDTMRAQSELSQELLAVYGEALEVAAQYHDREVWREYVKEYPVEVLPPPEATQKMRCSMLSRKKQWELQLMPDECP